MPLFIMQKDPVSPHPLSKNPSFPSPLSPTLDGHSETRPRPFLAPTEHKSSHVSKSLAYFCEAELRGPQPRLPTPTPCVTWSRSEDTRLLQLKPIFNQLDWQECVSFFPGRAAEQCRQRLWQLLQSELLVGNWSYQEQAAILKFACIHKFSWKTLGEMFPRRSQNSIKSYFHSTMRRLKKSFFEPFLKRMVAWPTYTNKSECKAMPNPRTAEDLRPRKRPAPGEAAGQVLEAHRLLREKLCGHEPAHAGPGAVRAYHGRQRGACGY